MILGRYIPIGPINVNYILQTLFIILLAKSFVLKYCHTVKNYGRLCDRSYNENNSYHDQQFFKYHKQKIQTLARKSYSRHQSSRRYQEKESVTIKEAKEEKDNLKPFSNKEPEESEGIS